MITAKQKRTFIKKENEAMKGYKKAGLFALARGEEEDLLTVKRLKVRRK